MRIWLANEMVYCVLNIGFWEERFDERECWGILLADVMHHIANAHQSEYGRDPTETLNIIRAMLEKELMRPTSDRLGDVVVNHDDGAAES